MVYLNFLLLGLKKSTDRYVIHEVFPNFPELSLNPEEFDLYSEFSSILSVGIVDAQRRIKSQFNTSLCPFSRFTIVSFEASSVILLISKDSTR